MVVEDHIRKLNELTSRLKTEHEEAVKSGKPFHIKKEIMERLKLVMKELEEWRVFSRRLDDSANKKPG